jgi:hypothetical protein
MVGYFSIIKVSAPNFEENFAAEAPAGPAPTIAFLQFQIP